MFYLGKKTCTKFTNKRPAATEKEKGSSKINIRVNHVLIFRVKSKTSICTKYESLNIQQMEICRDNCLKTFVTFALSLCDVGCINSCYQDVFKMNTDMIKNMRPFLDELWTLG